MVEGTFLVLFDYAAGLSADLSPLSLQTLFPVVPRIKQLFMFFHTSISPSHF